jgi:23S rRNA (cytosine1962-C5)-methyltransferase
MADLELLDCGGGRRLERFGEAIVDRPAPAADWIPRLPAEDWKRASFKWGKGAWVRGAARDPWTVRAGALTLECRPSPSGQLGVFPEHAGTWTWLERVVRAAESTLGRPPEVLSLFGYTGGATLACANAGARVAHVDSSRPAVAWARHNAELSGLTDKPVRWLIDDARTFAQRERRRGKRRIEEHLAPLLGDLAALVGPRPSFVLLSAHTPGYDGDRLAALIREHFGVPATGEPMTLESRVGSRLPLGAWAHSPVR